MPCIAFARGSRTRSIDGDPSASTVHRRPPTSTGTRMTVTMPRAAGPRMPKNSACAFGSHARPSTFSPPASGSCSPATSREGMWRSSQSRNPGIASARRSPWRTYRIRTNPSQAWRGPETQSEDDTMRTTSPLPATRVRPSGSRNSPSVNPTNGRREIRSSATPSASSANSNTADASLLSMKTNRPGATSATPEALNGALPFSWSNDVGLTFCFSPSADATLAIQFATSADQHGEPRLDHLVDDRQPLVERDECRLHRVDGEPRKVGPAVAERLDEPEHLLTHRRVAYQPVVGVDSDPEAAACQKIERMLGDAADGSRLHVGARAQLEWNSLVPQQRRQPTEVDGAVGSDRDVVDDPHPVAKPVGTAERDRLVNGGQAARLARVDREAGVVVSHVLEGVEVSRRWVACLGARDVEPHNALVPEPDRQLGDLQRPGLVAHRGHQATHGDRAPFGAGGLLSVGEARQHRVHHRVKRKPAVDVQFGCEPDLGVHDVVGGQILHALDGHPIQRLRRLHHPDRVRERLQVALERSAVRGGAEERLQTADVGGG